MNRQIVLREFRDEDMALLRSWLYADHVARWYERPLAWIEELEKRDGEFSWISHFIALYGGVPIGFCQYYEYRRGGESWHGAFDTAGAYSIDYLIGDPAHIGKGLGRELIAALIDEIKRHTYAQAIIVQPEPENKASCGALLSAGFAFDPTNKIYLFKL